MQLVTLHPLSRGEKTEGKHIEGVCFILEAVQKKTVEHMSVKQIMVQGEFK